MRVGTIMSLAAVVMVLATAAWGAYVYPSMPAELPTHWNARGQADAFSTKSFWSVFGALLVGGGVVVGTLLTERFVVSKTILTPSEGKAYNLMFGFLNLWMAGLFSWVSLAGWNDMSLGPWFIILALIGGTPVLVILGLHLPAIMKERKAMIADDEPSMNPKHWVWGGMFYSNDRDSRVWVPKPPHTGIGMTVNLATPGGRLFMIGIGVVLVGTLLLGILL